MPNVTVIGAGPAGSATAILLARAGWDVTVIEQHTFPREKVCGECVSHLGFQVLGRLELADAVRKLGAVELKRAVLHAPDGTAAEVELPESMWGISRARLDPMLLDEAKRRGAKVMQPARAEGIAEEPLGVIVRRLRENAVERVESDWVVVAEGRAALLPQRPEGTGELGIKAHFEGVESSGDAIELFGVAGHYVGLAPVEGGVWNVAYAVPEGRVKGCRGDLEALWEELLGENRGMMRKFATARRVSSWVASPLPRFGVTGGWPAGVVAVGNAAAALEPIGGEGMGLALASAEMAAGAMIEAGRDWGHAAVAGLPGRYRRLWGTRRVACRVGAMLLSNPRTSGVSVDLLRSIPSLAGVSLGLIGK